MEIVTQELEHANFRTLQQIVADVVWDACLLKKRPQFRYAGRADAGVSLIVSSVEDISPDVKAVLVVEIPLGIW